MIRWLLFLIVYFALSFYTFQALKTGIKQIWVHYLFILLAVLIAANLIYQFTLGEDTGKVLSRPKSYAFGFLLAMVTFQIITILFLFSEDLFRWFTAIYHKLTGSTAEFSLPQRRRFLSVLGLGIAAVPFGAILYGMYKGKYRFKVLKYTMEYEDLPEAFDGYKITQLSDIHSGSLDNRKKVEYGIELANKQNSDLLLFTGDIVNNKAEELLPWAEAFAKLRAKDGKFSVLGNHDYGDYVEWESPEAKASNLEDLKTLQKDIGFDLLLNESRYIEKDGARIALIGVENWGKGGFVKAGDLQKAKSNVAKDDFKILMSHDPSHWEAEVIPDAYHFHLTLSGHTHGMQFGIEIPGWFKWSPVKWRYKQWAGIYEEMNQFINVNRGFGFLGYPGRVGIWPEITVITLKKKR